MVSSLGYLHHLWKPQFPSISQTPLLPTGGCIEGPPPRYVHMDRSFLLIGRVGVGVPLSLDQVRRQKVYVRSSRLQDSVRLLGIYARVPLHLGMGVCSRPCSSRPAEGMGVCSGRARPRAEAWLGARMAPTATNARPRARRRCIDRYRSYV